MKYRIRIFTSAGKTRISDGGFYLTPEEALRILAIGPEYSQVVIKTEKAAKKLRFIRSERIEKADATARQKEQEAFQEAFAREIEKIMKA